MVKMIPHLSGKTWQEIVQSLGTGDFVRIEFRPPNGDEENFLAEMNGLTSRSSWWICEAVYHVPEMHKDHRTTWSEVTQKIPFRLYEDHVS